MVNTAMVSNYCRFANHNAYTVVDGEIFANSSSRVDINTSCFMGMFSYYSGYYFCVKFIELVGNSVGQYGIVGGIGNNYFGVVQAGWIAMVDRFQVFETEILYVRQSVYETVFN